MITLYTWGTPNGYKVSILLEELGLPYRVVPVHIGQGQQHAPDYLAISPNGKIPAIVDEEGPGGQPFSLAESGAILWYLAEKTGRFLAKDPATRYQTLQWLMFQMASVGPMFGQAHHFRRFAPEQVPYGIERYSAETARLYGVLEARLTGRDYLVDDYSIADMAVWPWVARHEWQGIDLAAYPAVQRWFQTIAARPAVQQGVKVPQ